MYAGALFSMALKKHQFQQACCNRVLQVPFTRSWLGAFFLIGNELLRIVELHPKMPPVLEFRLPECHKTPVTK